MITLEKNYQAVCALSSLLGPAPVSSFTSFFNADCKDSVLLILEKLLSLGVLTKQGELIYPPKEKQDASTLFRLEEKTEVHEETVDREHIRAVENLVISKSVSLKAHDLLHLANSEKIQAALPSFSLDLFLLIRDLLKNANIFIETNKSIFINKEAEKEILSLDRLSLIGLIMTSIFNESFSSFTGDIVGFFSKYSTDEEGLNRIVKLFLIKNSHAARVEDVIDGLLDMKVLVRSDNNLYNLNLSYLEEEKEGSVLCDSDFSVHITGSPDLKSRLHVFCTLKICDRVTEYTFDKASFFRGLDEGLTTKEMLKALGKSDFSEITKSWEEEYNRIRIYRGTVISCTDDIALIITGVPEISSFIISKISENVFLMSDENYNKWSTRLSSILNMENLPKITAEETMSPSLPMVDKVTVKKNITDSITNNHQEVVLRLAEDQKSLQNALKGVPGQSQSGMDYRGKLTLLNDAVKRASTSLLLMELLEDKTVVAKPIGMRRANGQDHLLFKNIFTGEEELIKVGAIYSVKLVELQALH